MMMSKRACLTARPTAAASRISIMRVPRVQSVTDSVRASALATGDQLPAFELETDASTEAHKVTLKSQDMVREKGAVLFFYPKAATSGCTAQACAFNDNYSSFESAGYGVYGISADLPAAQLAWKQEHGFCYPLLSDPGTAVLSSLGVTKEGGGVNRSHIIVEKGGRVKEVVYGVSSKESMPSALKSVQ